MASDDITKLHDLIGLSHTKIREYFMKHQNKIVARTRKYYKDCGRSDLEKVLIGNADPYYKPLYKINKETGKIDNDFTYKNPWDLNENLKDHERSYLKFITWEMYKWKAKLSSEFIDMDYEQVEKHDKFKEFIKDKAFLQVPLVKRIDANKIKSLTTQNLWESVGRRWEDFKDMLDPRNLTEAQRKDAENEINGAYKMYNEFNMDDKFRDNLIDKYKDLAKNTVSNTTFSIKHLDLN